MARVNLSGPEQIWMGSTGTTYSVMVKSPLDFASYDTLDLQYHGECALLILAGVVPLLITARFIYQCAIINYCDRFIYQMGVMGQCIPPVVVQSNKSS